MEVIRTSAMLTCAGRLAAHTIASATSSGASGVRLAYTLAARCSSPRNRIFEKSVSTMPGSIRCDADGRSEQILAQPFADGALGRFGGAVHGAAGIGHVPGG